MSRDGEIVAAGLAFVGILLGVYAATFVSTLFVGYAFSLLWGWYVVPMGLAPITVLHGAGLALLLNLVTDNINFGNRHHENVIMTTLTYLYVRPFIYILFGWLILLMM